MKNHLKCRNIYGKKLTQFTRSHKHPITIHKIVYADEHIVVKEYHGNKVYLYVSDDRFTQLSSYACPLGKRKFNEILTDYFNNPYTVISEWSVEVII